jgi:ion channel
LIVLTVVIHVLGLGLIRDRAIGVWSAEPESRRDHAMFALVMGAAVLLVTVLHAFKGLAWATAYYLLGALPDAPSAMLYSLGAMTTYGHADLHLDTHWQMMGALEALNGMLLFGLTTAFLFAIIERVWRTGRSVSESSRPHQPNNALASMLLPCHGNAVGFVRRLGRIMPVSRRMRQGRGSQARYRRHRAFQLRRLHANGSSPFPRLPVDWDTL